MWIEAVCGNVIQVVALTDTIICQFGRPADLSTIRQATVRQPSTTKAVVFVSTAADAPFPVAPCNSLYRI